MVYIFLVFFLSRYLVGYMRLLRKDCKVFGKEVWIGLYFIVFGVQVENSYLTGNYILKLLK